ncbi:hypothetical protein V494_07078 [Pseudogymnoascus sp. VKM F-4513 (FW-928)]|nr:hypothetical protein V494_07078 [Pseudogymnoascus sp. VKM F-4513 (FW-928)]
MTTTAKSSLKRNDDRIIIHFDYDCFYASVFEVENPALKSVPLGVQQKQIIVTCNYEARRRGLHKLQLVSEAKKKCPDMVVVLGEQLDRFRDASKMLYKFLESFTWNNKVEKLGFDEVFLDVTDIVAYNQSLLNPNDLSHAFFNLSRDDPTAGFSFDASRTAGHEYPDLGDAAAEIAGKDQELLIRLRVGSHLAQHLRHRLEEDKGYTSTVGVSTSKLLAKLAGNLHKPKAQTTLMPPYESISPEDPAERTSTVIAFLDTHDIGKIPGIGFKMSQKIRDHILERKVDSEVEIDFHAPREFVAVRDVRLFPGMGPELLDELLGGVGAERGIGGKAWALINGIDDSEVQTLKRVPTQISIEDSYRGISTLPEVRKELRVLATSLINRMHTDLLEPDEDNPGKNRWLAHPKTIRLSTRPQLPRNPDGSRQRGFNRISRSCPLPNFVFNLREGVDALVEKLVLETLIPLFHRLHDGKGWSLNLINICVANMVETASETVKGRGRDISRMFKHQEEVLKEWKVEDKDVPPDWVVEQHGANGVGRSHAPIRAEPSAGNDAIMKGATGSEDVIPMTQDAVDDESLYFDEESDSGKCAVCNAIMPAFAMAAHERYHEFENLSE